MQIIYVRLCLSHRFCNHKGSLAALQQYTWNVFKIEDVCEFLVLSSWIFQIR